jgi:uncharacterized membrane protein/protein-disulfide isomerase
MKKSKAIKTFPLPVYSWTVILLAIAGLANSIYLSISHYRIYTDIGYRSFCAISRAINCDTVSQSAYSIWGGVPVPVWGIIGYTSFLLLLPFAGSKSGHKMRVWSLLFVVSLAFSAYSIFLAVIATFYIHSYCIMCIVSYGINFLLLYYTWIIHKRFVPTSIVDSLKRDANFFWNKRLPTAYVFGPFLIGIISVLVLFPDYWRFELPKLSATIPSGITEAGHPWIGAQQPEIVVTEFADYQCFQCKKMHFFLRRLISEYPEKIRIIHRQFPLDHQYNPIVKEPFHVGSGAMAIFAEFAITRGKFWEMNDALYGAAGKQNIINIKELAEKTGLDYRMLSSSLKDPNLRYRVKHDIAIGIKLGITATPGYLINGTVYLGQVPPEIISSVLD